MLFVRKSIINISKEERKEIESFIENNSGLVFHIPNFNEIVSKYFKTSFFYYLVYDNNKKIIAVCPLHIIKKKIINYVYSNPSQFDMPYGGWVYDERKITLNKLLDGIKLKFNEILIYFSSIQINHDLYKNIPFVKDLETSIIDLSLSEDEIWGKYINSKRRNMIRKALKTGIEIRQKGFEGIDEYFSLMIDLYQKLGYELKPKKFYKEIIRFLNHDYFGRVFLAYLDDDLLSGVIIIGNKNVVHYWQGASKSRTKNLGQGELLQWNAIKSAKLFGAKYYDLCVIKKDKLPNIAKFKLGFSKNTVNFYSIEKKNISSRIFAKFERYV